MHMHTTRCLIIWGHARPDTFAPHTHTRMQRHHLQSKEITREGVEFSHQDVARTFAHIHKQQSFDALLAQQRKKKEIHKSTSSVTGFPSRPALTRPSLTQSVNTDFDGWWHISCLVLLSETCSLVRLNSEEDHKKGAGGNYIHIL